MRRGPRTTQAGFTFLELIVTMSLMAILLAIALPNFRGLGSPFALRQAATQIAADFQSTRMRAIARNASYRFTYDSTTHTYAMQRLVGGSWVTERSSQLPTGVTVGTVNTTPTFNSRGMLNTDATIPLSTIDGKSKTVTINVLGHTTIS